MVKVGFIGEGFIEVMFIKSPQFVQFLVDSQISFVDEPINAKGQDRLRTNIDAFRSSLFDEGATHIFILTDLDNAQSFSRKKEFIGNRENQTIILSVKAFEAWFLADSEMLQKLLNNDQFEFDYPEKETEPFDTIRKLLLGYTNRGIGEEKKRIFASQCFSKYGFSIQRAAQHPNCPSANYFLNKLQSLNSYLI